MVEPTPGPWEMDEEGVIFNRKQGINICSVYPYQRKGNGQLISAAPDLLEALIGVVAVADRKTVEFDKAHAAIRKAKGESDA